MDKKTFLQYEWMVLCQAHTKAWHAIGGRGRLISIFVAIIAFVMVSHPTTLVAGIMNTAVIGAVIFAIMYAVLLIWFFGREPMLIHNEKVSENEQLQDEKAKEIDQLQIKHAKEMLQLQGEKQALIEQALPKLELKYVTDHASSRYTGMQDGSPTVHFRVNVKNISTIASIQNIKAELLETNQHPPLLFLAAELGIMNDEETQRTDSLNAGTSLRIDAVNVISIKGDETNKPGHLVWFGFKKADLKNKRTAFEPTSPMTFTIQVSGTGTTICKTFELYSRDENNQPIFDLREVNNGQEKCPE